MNSDRILCSYINEALCSTDSVAGNRHSLDDSVGVTFKNGTVHECTRVTFVGVAAYILLIRNGNDSTSHLPLSACGESTASASAKSGFAYNIDNLLRRHLCNYLFESLVTVFFEVIIDVLGIYNTAVAKCNTMLLLIEVCLIVGNDAVGSLCLFINILLNDAVIYKMFLNYLLDVIRAHHRVECSLGIYYHDRTESTETEASCSYNLYMIVNTFFLYLFFKLVGNLHASGRGTACTAAN